MFIFLRAIWGLLPLRGWLYLGAALALFLGYAYWTHHEQAIGRDNCEAAQAAKQVKIDELQGKLDKEIEEKNKSIHARYESLASIIGVGYVDEPINLDPSCKPSVDFVRSINQAHSRQPL